YLERRRGSDRLRRRIRVQTSPTARDQTEQPDEDRGSARGRARGRAPPAGLILGLRDELVRVITRVVAGTGEARVRKVVVGVLAGGEPESDQLGRQRENVGPPVSVHVARGDDPVAVHAVVDVGTRLPQGGG